jgi:hypothetical protein
MTMRICLITATALIGLILGTSCACDVLQDPVDHLGLRDHADDFHLVD